MAVAYRSGNTAFKAAGGGSTLTINAPSGVTDGDTLIAHVQVGGTNNAPTAPAGWTTLDTNTSPTPSCRTWWKIANTEGASYAFTVNSGSAAAGVVLAYSGGHASTPIDQHTLLNGASGTTVSATGATPSVDNCMVVMIGSISNSSTWTAPGTYTARNAIQNGHSVGSFEKLQTTATATGTVSATASTGGTHNGSLFVIKPPDAAPSGASDLTGAGSLAATGAKSGNASITFVAGDKTFKASGTTALTITVPAGTANDDTMLAMVQVGGTGNVPATPTGWTQLDSQSAATPSAATYVRKASSEPANYTWTTNSASNAVGMIVTYRGADLTTPTSVHSILNGSSGTAVHTTAIAPSSDNCMIVQLSQINSSSTWTVPGGYTARTAIQNTMSAGAFELLQTSAANTGDVQSTASVGGTHNGGLIALNPAGFTPATKTGSAALKMAVTQVGGTVGCYFGAYPGTETRGGTMSSAITTIESNIQRPLAVIRTFRTTADSWPTANDQAVVAAGKQLMISWKPTTYTWAQVAAGSADSYIDARATGLIALGNTVPIYFTFHHEMDGGSAAGYGTAAEFVSAWQHVISRLRSAGVNNCTYVVIYQNFSFSAGSGRTPINYWPGSSYADMFGSDGYNNTQQGNHSWQDVATVFDNTETFANTHGINWCIPEVGCPEDLDKYHSPSDPNRKADWLAEVVTTLQGYAHFVGPFVYFDTYKPTEFVDEDWSSDSSATSLAGFVTMSNDSYFFPIPATAVLGGVLSATGQASGGQAGAVQGGAKAGFTTMQVRGMRGL